LTLGSKETALRTRRLVLIVPLTATLAFAACGGSSSPSDSPSTSPSSGSGGSSGPAGGATAVKETEYKLNPTNATVTLKGATAAIEVSNDGKIVHALALEKAGPGGKDIESGNIQPGASKSLKLKLKPGTYEWYCPIDGHKKLGMVGKITVKG